MTDFTITYENNIFYCTKNNTKWISVDGEKWYGEEKRITELERKNRLLGERCNQLLKDKGDLTDQIADIKANCDLAIEGREAKIMELEKENAELKNKLTEKVTLKSLDVVSAKMNDLEKENAELKHTVAELRRDKDNLNTHSKAQEKLSEYRSDQLTKAKEIMNIAVEGIKYWGIVGGTERPFEKQAEMLFNLFLDKAEAFLDNEVEK